MLEPHWSKELRGKEQQKQDMATNITAKGTKERRWERIFPLEIKRQGVLFHEECSSSFHQAQVSENSMVCEIPGWFLSAGRSAPLMLVSVMATRIKAICSKLA